MARILGSISRRIQLAAGRGRLVLATTSILIAALLWFMQGSAVGTSIGLKSPAQLHSYYIEQGYTMEALRAGNVQVPPVFITAVPEGWAKDLDVKQKKSLFFRTLLPLVLQVNKDILEDRARLAELQKRSSGGRDLSRDDHGWLRHLAERYDVIDLKDSDSRDFPTAAQLAKLTLRVDIIPPSLALSQGAIESAYALSRFAVEGNALFGQWHYGKGLKPEKQRQELGDYRIASFKTPIASVRGYAANLNTNPAYRPFREMRAVARSNDRVLHGNALVAGLKAYSERGVAYIDEVRGLIRVNGLSGTDTAELEDGPPIELRAGLF